MEMEINLVKEEIEENLEQKSHDNEENDYIVASYDISLVPSQRKCFAISGMTPVMNSSKKHEIGIRTDFKSLKISSELNRTKYVAYTKDTHTLLEQSAYAVKLSQEQGKAYMIPVNAFQVTSFVDEKDRHTKTHEDQGNDLVEDMSELPHPSRNKFNQLAIEMRHYLYKPLKIVPPAAQRQYLNNFFQQAGNRPVVDDQQAPAGPKPREEVQKPKIDMLKCDYSRMVRVNFLEIKQIANQEMRVEAFMRKAQLATFYEINSILGFEPEQQQVLLNCLQTYAHLIRGNWVIKSNLLYKTSIYDDETRKKHLEDLIALRESLLNSFVKDRKIAFSQVYDKFKKSKDHEEILTRLTVRSGTNHELKFILPEDAFFLLEFSDIAPRHAAKTEVALRKFENYIFT